MAQVDFHTHTMTVEYIDSLFKRLADCGCNAVLLCYRDKFPYTTFPDLAAPEAYSLAEVQQIDDSARRHGLEIIPLGMQFSHSSAILKHPRYKHLDGAGGGLNLLLDESLDIMVGCADDICRVHKGVKMVHFGGDEMQLGGQPQTGSYIRKHGASQYYVQFVNRLTAAMASRSIRPAIWSDMIIRYPQNLADMDKQAVIFYWDYWSYGERTPFVTIGGGLPDMFLLDPEKLQGDLRKLFLVSWPKPASDLPMEHLRRFEPYWQMDPQYKSVRSLPYAAWFKDNGFDVVGALTSYPEKSSFLPNFMEKFDHVRAWARRLEENRGIGVAACVWAMFFPLVETCMPSFIAVNAFMDNPRATDDEVCAIVAKKLGGFWTPQTVKAYFDAGSDFEAADTIAVTWSDKMTMLQRFAWLDKAGALDADMAMCRTSLSKIDALLAGTGKSIPADSYERFVLDDMRWRARLQIAWRESDKAAADALDKERETLEQRFRHFLDIMFKKVHHENIMELRYHPWRQLIQDIQAAE